MSGSFHFWHFFHLFLCVFQLISQREDSMHDPCSFGGYFRVVFIGSDKVVRIDGVCFTECTSDVSQYVHHSLYYKRVDVSNQEKLYIINCQADSDWDEICPR